MPPPASTEDQVFVIDNLPGSLRDQVRTIQPAEHSGDDNDSFHAPSVDTTYLASSVGSVVGPTRTAFLRSVTFSKDEPDDLRWDITFSDDLPEEHNNGGGRKMQKSFLGLRRNKTVMVASISGHMRLSKIQVGDVVTKINHKTIGPSYNAERVSKLLQQQQDPSNGNNIISIQTGNENGIDTIVQVTIIKPRPDMTAKELGLGVWWWRGLCVRYITPKTLAAMTALKGDDELESVNDIILEDNVTPEGFERIVKELPCEVTIVVKRGKQRWSGQFG
ncbi:hypothetical protein IV203_032096 [Nitzschia inconspicua]|uniref:PDZ domain-containing protein n=1 Tax=Nitzschia inconspicua TaxID=303405 RepID=A0A9K3P874_9STRA|nr:hypothetical protein IV203_011292 [Nitzschia inconspicua]KAG7369353.1 hypothetical protein IV203_032096 [Nitzschia inconspicua]